MQTLKWEENNCFEEEDESYQTSLHQVKGIQIEEEDYQAFQLRKFQDPSKDQERQDYLILIEIFGNLISSGQVQDIAKELLTEDCETFIFNAAERTPVEHGNYRQGFIDIYKNRQILERRTRETHVDVEKHTVCQISYYRVIHAGDSDPINEIACEIFSIRDGRICKLRASYGCPMLDEHIEDPLKPTKKDKMLAKVKQVNYVLAGQPDFEKMATLITEKTEYKIWRWDDFKCFTLCKDRFADSCKILEENMSIKCVIPYEISADPEAKFISANYVYKLEDNKSGKKFDWLSTCIYTFDKDINITKIIQQGELNPEGEMDIPFEVHTREKLENTVRSFYSGDIKSLDAFYSDNIIYDCSFWAIFSFSSNMGYFKGMQNIDKLIRLKAQIKDRKITLVKVVDTYVDHQSESHDVVFALVAFEGVMPCEGSPDKEISCNRIELLRMALENGKVAKSLEFLTKVETPIPSPFDDKNFHCINIK